VPAEWHTNIDTIQAAFPVGPEIIIGPIQNSEEARQRLNRLLTDCGYEIGQMEYPEITISKVVPWSLAVLTAKV